MSEPTRNVALLIDADNAQPRAIDPVHTMVDGDTLFGLATGARPAPTAAEGFDLLDAAATCVARAIGRAVSAARPGGPVEDPAVTEIRVAATAAAVARAVPGVARLQPGLWGLVHQLGNELWTHATGLARPDTAGVEVTIAHEVTTIDIAVVADGRRPAAVTAGEVQRLVHDAVRAAHDVRPERIAVHIVDIAVPV